MTLPPTRGTMIERHTRPARQPLFAPLGLRGVAHVRLAPRTTRTGTEAKLTYLRLYWIVEGAGFIRMDGKPQPLRAGDVVLYGPGPRSQVWTGEHAMTYHVLACDGPAMTTIADRLGLPRWPVRITADLSADFAALGASLARFDRRAELESSKRLYAFLLTLSQCLADSSVATVGAAWAVRVTRQMERQLGDGSLGFSQLAATVGMHRSAFTRRFTAVIGENPKVYLDRLRLNRAIALLAEPQLPISEVARRAGFTSGHGMAKVFRRLMGRTPGSFQR